MASSITIELISSFLCSRCEVARERVQSVLGELGDERVVYREINVLDELDYAVSMGVLMTPAIAIDGELIASGMLTKKRLRKELQQRLAALPS